MIHQDSSLPLVSVIIPCYNHAEYVQECIQSVVDQDYPNIELIIIDDGSQDNSVIKIEEMYDVCHARFIRFEFRHRQNIGLCATLNEALEWCEGEYTSSVASDDIWVKYKTSEQVAYLTQHPSCVGVFGGMILIDQFGQEVVNLVFQGNKKYTFHDIFLHNHFLPTPTNLCRTEKLRQYKYNANFKIEDWDMWLKLTEKGGSLDYIANNYAFYRRHDSNLSGNLDIMHNGRLEIIELYHGHKQYKKAIAAAYLASYFEDNNRKLCLLRTAIMYDPWIIFTGKFCRAMKERIKELIFNFLSKIRN